MLLGFPNLLSKAGSLQKWLVNGGEMAEGAEPWRFVSFWFECSSTEICTAVFGERIMQGSDQYKCPNKDRRKVL